MDPSHPCDIIVMLKSWTSSLCFYTIENQLLYNLFFCFSSAVSQPFLQFNLRHNL